MKRSLREGIEFGIVELITPILQKWMGVLFCDLKDAAKIPSLYDHELWFQAEMTVGMSLGF